MTISFDSLILQIPSFCRFYQKNNDYYDNFFPFLSSPSLIISFLLSVHPLDAEVVTILTPLM